MDAWLAARGLQRTGPVGHATAKLVDARDVVAGALELLARDPFVFLCATDQACEQCDAARASATADT
jgi:aminoglycoside 3-N-acetyltransferase